jgi:GNAT superfamily N-acetyltransferase
VIIRPVAASDRETWTQLFVDYGVFYETDFDAEVTSRVWHWLMDAAHEVKAVVAELDGELVGFAHYRRLADTFTGASSWNLDDLYVAPAARSHGLATALIETVAANAKERGGGTVRWITAADNTTAQRLYDKLAKRADWVTYELETLTPGTSTAETEATA